MATVELILGPMFSGKTSELNRRCKTFEAINKEVLVINSVFDTRCGDEIKTHSSETHSAIKTESLCKIDLDYNKLPDVIAIDEAQFFPDLYAFIVKMEKFRIMIIVAGLVGDFKRNNFGEIHRIIPLCDSVTKLSSMCSLCNDGTKASFTKRLQNNVDLQLCVGSHDKYTAVCRSHYLTVESSR